MTRSGFIKFKLFTTARDVAMTLKFGLHLFLFLIVFIFPVPLRSQPVNVPYQDPLVRTSLEAMTAQQMHVTNWGFYTQNVDTPGFVEVGVYNREEDGKIQPAVFYRWRAGPVTFTGKDLNFYLDSGSRGLFTIQLPFAKGYTRDGRFKIAPNRALVTYAGGYPVLGENGPIIMPEGDDISVSTTGVVFVDGARIDKMAVAIFKHYAKPNLVSLNGVVFYASGFIEPELLDGDEHYRVRQGYLEESNVLKALTGDIGWATNTYTGITKVLKSTTRMMTSAVQMGSPQ